MEIQREHREIRSQAQSGQSSTSSNNFNIVIKVNFDYTEQVMSLIYKCSQLSLSRSRRDPLKHFEIPVFRHIRLGELRTLPIEQPNFTNEHVI